MRPRGWVSWIIVVICGMSLFETGPARAESAVAEVRAAVNELHAWLATDPSNGPAWRKYLKSDELMQQLARGSLADPQHVKAILDVYKSDAPGLDRRRFVAVRQALEAWARELARPRRIENLPQAIRDAQKKFVPVTKQDAARAKTGVLAALGELEKYLTSLDPVAALKWKEALGWDELQAQLNAKDGADWQVLQTIAAKYYLNKDGLELPVFLHVRQTLGQYINCLWASTTPDLQKQYEQQLQELATRLEAYAKKPATDEGMRIGRTLGWLEQCRQAPALVAAVRSQYQRPNLLAQLSGRLVNAGIETEVDETTDVDEVILGTSMHGEARMQGNLTTSLVPNSEKAAFDLVLLGTTVSNNVGYNGPVTVFTHGVTSVDARKQLLIDATGVAADPARALCATTSTINAIHARCRLVERIGWRRANKTKAQAEAIASQRAARRIADKVDEGADDLLDKANYAFMEDFRKPLLRRDGLPQSMLFQTTDAHLTLVAMQAGQFDLAAATEPPTLSGNHDFAVRLHESLVGNFCQAVFGGLTLTDERVVELVEDTVGNLPEELALGPDKEPWSITFASERPIEMRFVSDGFSVIVRGKRFTRGDQELKRTMHVSASYKILRSPQGAKLVRQGDVQVDLPGAKQLTVAQVATKTFMKKKFESLFKAEVASQGVELPGRYQKLGRLHLQQLHCADGWLALGWAVRQGEKVAMKD